MDIIHIKNLELFANHGVYKQENELGQKFIVNADLYTDFTKAAKGDNLEYSVDYGTVAKEIVDFLHNNTYRLIETAAQKLAEHLLVNMPQLRAVRLELKKPWAPIKYTVETVSVEIYRSWHKVYLSLGTNVGERSTYLENAFNALAEAYGVRLGRISPVYETEAYGGVEQPDFLNVCAEIDTILEPHELLELVNSIEADNGRERIIHWGPRTLDIDILLYDDLVLHDEELSIPHSDMTNRLFVLQPLDDIAPNALHPVKSLTIHELYIQLLKETGSEKKV